MKKVWGVVLPLGLLFINQCAAPDEGVSSTTTVTERVVFSFEPAFSEFDGAGIAAVYLCGSFNDWSLTADPMELNVAEGRYELPKVLASGTHAYRFRVEFDSPFHYYSTGETNCSELWFADPRASSYQRDIVTGDLNALVSIPYSVPMLCHVSGGMSNVADCEILICASSNDGIRDCVQALDAGASISYEFDLSQGSTAAIRIRDACDPTNSDSGRFLSATRTVDLEMLSNVSVVPIDFSYDNMMLSPSQGAIVSNGDILFNWDNSPELGVITSVHLLVSNSTTGECLITNVTSYSGSFYLDDDSVFTGNSQYFWRVIFVSDGWVVSTHYCVIIITNL